jgi:hypothetical protein
MTTGLGHDTVPPDGALPTHRPGRRWAPWVRTGVVLTVVVAVALLVRGGADGGGAAVSEAEARAFLDGLVDAGLAGDFDRLCAGNGSEFNCRMSLDGGSSGTVPDEPPSSVIATFVPAGPDVDIPGWLLTVRGRNGLGVTYTTELVVFREDDTGDLAAINAVWWSGDRIASGDPNGWHSP